MGNGAGSRLSTRRGGEFNAFRPGAVRCQALRPERSFNWSGPRGQSRPERIRVHRPVYPLERGIQKIPNLLQTGMQFRWRLLIGIIRKPQRLRHQAPNLAQFRHSAPLQAWHSARPAAAKLQHLLGANGCEPLHLQLRTIDKAALHQRYFSEDEAGCSSPSGTRPKRYRRCHSHPPQMTRRHARHGRPGRRPATGSTTAHGQQFKAGSSRPLRPHRLRFRGGQREDGSRLSELPSALDEAGVLHYSGAWQQRLSGGIEGGGLSAIMLGRWIGNSSVGARLCCTFSVQLRPRVATPRGRSSPT